ncbi:MAG: hypothetical protein HRU77_01650 [Gammaproteobacteria bacterium]|nr:MAG: hypothetical protein HRU77_01650 [Gammaproteobacteria bacterium]
MKLSQQAVALRIRENEWDALERDLDNLVLNRSYPLDIPKMLECIQESLTKRQGFIPANTIEHVNIQQDVNVLEALINNMTLNHETDGLMQRAVKLEDLKIAVSKVGLTA